MLTDGKIFDDPKRAVQLGLGVYSPLWPTFIAAAGAGVAFWAWAQWARGKAQHEFAGVLESEIVVAPIAPLAAFEPAPAPPELEAEPEPQLELAETVNDASAALAAPEPEIEADPVIEPVALAPVESAPEIVAAPEPSPEPVPAPKAARRKRPAPLVEAARPLTVVEPIAAKSAAAAKTRKSAPVSPRKARAAKAAAIVDTAVKRPRGKR